MIFVIHSKVMMYFYQKGAVDLVAFDKMVEAAAKAPRALGLAPKTKDIFPTDEVNFEI